MTISNDERLRQKARNLSVRVKSAPIAAARSGATIAPELMLIEAAVRSLEAKVEGRPFDLDAAITAANEVAA